MKTTTFIFNLSLLMVIPLCASYKQPRDIFSKTTEDYTLIFNSNKEVYANDNRGIIVNVDFSSNFDAKQRVLIIRRALQDLLDSGCKELTKEESADAQSLFNLYDIIIKKHEKFLKNQKYDVEQAANSSETQQPKETLAYDTSASENVPSVDAGSSANDTSSSSSASSEASSGE